MRSHVAKRMMMTMGAGIPPWYISLPGTGASGIDGGNHASLANLSDAAFTAEAWFKQDIVQPDTTVTWMNKGSFVTAGWLIYLNATTITALIDATTDANTGYNIAIRDGLWHHLAVCYDDTGTRKINIAVDGIWGFTTQTAAIGATVDDSANKLKIGVRGDGANWRYAGGFGWIRISNTIRYTVGVNFTPPARAYPPVNDANTVRLFWVDEGSGATLTDKSTNLQNATVTTGTWVRG